MVYYKKKKRKYKSTFILTKICNLIIKANITNIMFGKDITS